MHLLFVHAGSMVAHASCFSLLLWSSTAFERGCKWAMAKMSALTLRIVAADSHAWSLSVRHVVGTLSIALHALWAFTNFVILCHAATRFWQVADSPLVRTIWVLVFLLSQ